MYTLLFVTYGGGHATMVAPVIEHIQKESSENFKCVALALTMAGPLFEARGIPYLGFKDFLRDDDDAARAYGVDLIKNSHSPHTGISYEESVAYLGLSYADLVAQHGESEASKLVQQKGRMAFLPVPTLRRIIAQVKPDVVVTTNSPRAELAARLVAKESGIPTVGLTDLVGKDLVPLEANHLCIASRSAMHHYQNSPVIRAEHFHLTGNPAMDKTLQYRGPIDFQWRNRFFPSHIAHKPFVLSSEQSEYTHLDGTWRQFSASTMLHNLDRLYDACRANDAILLVRPRPSISPDLYRYWITFRQPDTVFMADQFDLHPLLKACNLVVANTSTILLDMLYMDRPVLLLHYPEGTTHLPLDELGIAFSARIDDPDGLSGALHRALTDTAAQKRHMKALNEEFPPLPCAPRVVEIIQSVATGSRGTEAGKRSATSHQ